jgi:hypothetical protein
MLRSKNFLSGLMMMAFGLGAVWQAFSYRLGTSTQMGPGYFPMMLGIGLSVIGLFLAAGAVLRPDGESKVEPVRAKTLLLPLAAVILFGLLIQPAGLVVALAVLVALARLASPDFRLRELAAMVVVIGVVVTAIFVFGLSIPIRLWPV